MKYAYVTMIDTFLSGWGEAEGKVSRLTIKCKPSEVMTVYENALNREDMIDVGMREYLPLKNPQEHHVVKGREEAEDFFIEGRW